MIGFAYFDDDGHFLRIQVVVLEIVEDFLMRVGMELPAFGLDIEQAGDVDSLGVDDL